MRDSQLRTSIGLFWVIAHIGVVLTICICFASGGFEFEDASTLLAIVLPMFSGISTVIVKYFAKHRHGVPKGHALAAAYVILTYLLPVVFTGLIIGIIIAK